MKSMKIKNKGEIEYYPEDEKIQEDLYMSKVEVLLESLPYIKQYFGEIVVVKVGGSMMEKDAMLQSALNDLILMKYVGMKIVLIHGGGKQITKLMEEKGIEAKFVDGLRVTDEETINIVKMVLIGDVNVKIVSLLNKHGKISMGISGSDANFIQCSKKQYKKNGKNIDLGYVGEINDINSDFIVNILNDKYIPVIASLGVDGCGNIYNINADTCACEIAKKKKKKKMILLTDVDGIIKYTDGKEKLVSRLTSEKCLQMVKSGEINSGMIPKVKACINALEGGVGRAHILNGTVEHSILVEIFTDKGIGTMITN